MTSLNRLAAELNDSADRLGDVDQQLGAIEDQPLDWFANASGRPGEVGRRLSAQLSKAWNDRSTEVSDAQNDLIVLAEAVERALVRYAQTDDHSRHDLGRLRAEDM